MRRQDAHREGSVMAWGCGRTIGIVLVVCVLTAPPIAAAQDRPFVFSMTTAPEIASRQIRIDYDVGLGNQTFRSQQTNGPDHMIGAQVSMGRWTLVGRFTASPADGTAYERSQSGEVLYSFLTPATSGLSFAAGGGMLHEAGGTDVLMARVTAGREAPLWRLHGNMLLQKPLVDQGRDAMDVITSVGWARRVTRSWSLGLEAVGEDLEGFWDTAEAEGGARLLVGPSLHLAPTGRLWQVTVTGGPMFHPRPSGLSSEALRDLPPQTSKNGYAIKTSFSASF